MDVGGQVLYFLEVHETKNPNLIQYYDYHSTNFGRTWRAK